MSPGGIKVLWPSADEIARSLVTACRIEGDDPIAVLKGEQGPRSRVYALLALAHEYPTTPRRWLGRALGNERVQPKVLTTINRQAAQWFVLERLNDVRAACGWSPMTMEDVLAAPLLYCGRSWEEFVDRSAEDARLSYSEAGSSVDAGPAREEAPAPIQSSVTIENSPVSVAGDVRRIDREKGADAGPSVEKAPAAIPEVEAAPAFDPDAEVGAMLARVERRKAWLAGEPPVVAEVEAPLPPASVEIDVDTPVEPISVSLEAVETAIADLPLLPPKATPAPAPAPFTPSPRAAALAQAARSMGASKPASALRPQSPGSIGAHVRRVSVDRFAAGGARKQAPKPNEIADTRPVRSDLSAFRAAALSAGASLSYRADPPAEQRGMVNVTAELMGDPTPQQRARMQQTPGVNVSKYIGGADLG